MPKPTKKKETKEIKRAWDKCWRYPCSDGWHNSFWATVVQSPQWQAWAKEVSRRLHKQIGKTAKKGVWDVDECQECGWISHDHFQDFLSFVEKQYKDK